MYIHSLITFLCKETTQSLNLIVTGYILSFLWLGLREIYVSNADEAYKVGFIVDCAPVPTYFY